MTDSASLRALFPLAGLLLALGVAGCNCNDVTECFTDENCEVQDWDLSQCTRAQGHWECHDRLCVETCGLRCQHPGDCVGGLWNAADAGCDEQAGAWVCVNGACKTSCAAPECTLAGDCAATAWPADAGCAQADGMWDCQAGACTPLCDVECVQYGDCAGKVWPPPQQFDCVEDHGHWECVAGACVPACNTQCDRDADCQAQAWPQACGGNWDCIQGLCQPVCDAVGCGDATCAAAAGETRASCPADCQLTCSVDADCVDGGEVWTPPCVGRWTCEAVCAPSCDYSTCGDASCNASVGEDAVSCPPDCLSTCQWPTDCTHNTWSQICQGRHTCFLGSCQQTCDSNGCGNGVCNGALGETADSCFRDCLGGPCSATVECLGNRWYERTCTGGHWSCTQPAGACQAVCDEVGCGNGTCDVLSGEAAASCPSDCGQYDCDLSADCSALTLPSGCSRWLCVKRNCSPVCP